MRPPALADLRRHAIARSLFAPTTLPQAIARLGFVQADPIRAPARAQDQTLRHRVRDDRAGELERRCARLAIEEDFFVNHGFVPRATHALMHPREVDAHFAHGKAKNWFGGGSNASTPVLDGMHYRGLLRIARREGRVRVYPARDVHGPTTEPVGCFDALADIVVAKYAPLSELVLRLRLAVPQWGDQRAAALQRAKARLPWARIDGVTWYWAAGENPASHRHAEDGQVRLLAPFDPVVWDRRRFEAFWGWACRFEAYTPPAQRVRGCYALPLLWRDQVIGWANVEARDRTLATEVGFVAGKPPRGPAFRRALDDELERMQRFLAL